MAFDCISSGSLPFFLLLVLFLFIEYHTYQKIFFYRNVMPSICLEDLSLMAMRILAWTCSTSSSQSEIYVCIDCNVAGLSMQNLHTVFVIQIYLVNLCNIEHKYHYERNDSNTIIILR